MKKTFRDLRAFQRALDFMMDVYAVTRRFPKEEQYGLTSQVRRAACSVVSNIAEGQGRTYGEWRQHLSEARGSLYEAQAQLIAAERLEFIEARTALALEQRANDAAASLQGLIEWVRKREAEAKVRSRTKPQEPTHSP